MKNIVALLTVTFFAALFTQSCQRDCPLVQDSSGRMVNDCDNNGIPDSQQGNGSNTTTGQYDDWHNGHYPTKMQIQMSQGSLDDIKLNGKFRWVPTNNQQASNLWQVDVNSPYNISKNYTRVYGLVYEFDTYTGMMVLHVRAATIPISRAKTLQNGEIVGISHSVTPWGYDNTGLDETNGFNWSSNGTAATVKVGSDPIYNKVI